MDRASYTTVIDTPDIIHAQQMRNIVSQVNECIIINTLWTRRKVTLHTCAHIFNCIYLRFLLIVCLIQSEKVQGRGWEDHVSLCTSPGHSGDAESPWEPEELQHGKYQRMNDSGLNQNRLLVIGPTMWSSSSTYVWLFLCCDQSHFLSSFCTFLDFLVSVLVLESGQDVWC